MAGICYNSRMSKTRKDLDSLTALGRTVRPAGGYDPSLLDSFENRHPERDYWVTFTCPEFTTLCPKTGQPDFATLTIRYIPSKRLVESKSLKLYLFGFRNHGDFHEDVVNIIYDDLARLLKPKYMEVIGKFAARGGISIDPFVNGGSGAKYRRLAEVRFNAWNGVRGA